jgi:hypothetical protein
MHTHSCCKSFHGNLSSHPLHCSTATLHTHTQGKLRHDDGCVEIRPLPRARTTRGVSWCTPRCMMMMLMSCPGPPPHLPRLHRKSGIVPSTPCPQRRRDMGEPNAVPPDLPPYLHHVPPGRYTRSQAVARVATTPAAVKWAIQLVRRCLTPADARHRLFA